jgi:hypothetical protein
MISATLQQNFDSFHWPDSDIQTGYSRSQMLQYVTILVGRHIQSSFSIDEVLAAAYQLLTSLDLILNAPAVQTSVVDPVTDIACLRHEFWQALWIIGSSAARDLVPQSLTRQLCMAAMRRSEGQELPACAAHLNELSLGDAWTLLLHHCRVIGMEPTRTQYSNDSYWETGSTESLTWIFAEDEPTPDEIEVARGALAKFHASHQCGGESVHSSVATIDTAENADAHTLNELMGEQVHLAHISD